MNKNSILIIENDDSLRQLLSHMLGKQYEIAAEHSGEKAMKWLSDGNVPNLVLMEAALPGISSTEILEFLKVSGIYRDIPVLLLSGRTDEDLARQLMQKGADAVMIKPFNPDELLSHLDSLIQAA